MDNQVIDYPSFVHKLFKDPATIQETLTPEKINLLHAAVGISGEAGELLDAIKKHVVYNKPIDIANVIEELGDLMFYMQAMMNQLDVSWPELEDNNMAKLSERYKGLTYSDKAAQERADKTITGETK